MKTCDEMIESIYWNRSVINGKVLEGYILAICTMFNITEEYVKGREQQFIDMVVNSPECE